MLPALLLGQWRVAYLNNHLGLAIGTNLKEKAFALGNGIHLLHHDGTSFRRLLLGVHLARLCRLCLEELQIGILDDITRGLGSLERRNGIGQALLFEFFRAQKLLRDSRRGLLHQGMLSLFRHVGFFILNNRQHALHLRFKVIQGLDFARLIEHVVGLHLERAHVLRVLNEARLEFNVVNLFLEHANDFVFDLVVLFNEAVAFGRERVVNGSSELLVDNGRKGNKASGKLMRESATSGGVERPRRVSP